MKTFHYSLIRINPGGSIQYDGKTLSVRYCNDYLNLSNKLGPSFQMWDDNGILIKSMFFVDGKLHREDGPASTYRCKHGVVLYEDSYLNGCFMDTRVNICAICNERNLD